MRKNEEGIWKIICFQTLFFRHFVLTAFRLILKSSQIVMFLLNNDFKPQLNIKRILQTWNFKMDFSDVVTPSDS